MLPTLEKVLWLGLVENSLVWVGGRKIAGNLKKKKKQELLNLFRKELGVVVEFLNANRMKGPEGD